MFIKCDRFPAPTPSGRRVKPTQICLWFSLSLLPGLKAVSFLSQRFLCLPWLSVREPATAGEEGCKCHCVTKHPQEFIPQSLAQLVLNLPCFPSSFWGLWLLQFPVPSNPVEPPIPAAFFLTLIYNYR